MMLMGMMVLASAIILALINFNVAVTQAVLVSSLFVCTVVIVVIYSNRGI